MVVGSKDSKKVAEEFGDDVRHVNGNLFKVKHRAINIARAGLSSDEGRLVYGNPRWFLNGDGQQEAKGLNRAKMEELKGSIAEGGMDHPIRLRATKDAGGRPMLEIVNGERRFRAIGELMQDDEECFDSASGSMRPAKETYEWVECRVEYMDDASALCCALKLNETGEVIGETANLQVVKVLRESGYDDQEILKATGKSIAWLRETERLIGLDEVCLENLRSDQINRQVALRLASVKDIDERVSLLEKIKEVAMTRHADMVRQAKEKAGKAKKKAEESVVEAFEAEINPEIDNAKAEKKAKKAKQALERAESEVEEVSKKKPKAKSRDVQEAMGTSNPLSTSKIVSLYLKPLADLIENEGGTDAGVFDMAHLMLIQAILMAITEGNEDMLAVLHEHCPIELAEAESDSSEWQEVGDEDGDNDEDEDEDGDNDDDDDDDSDEDDDDDGVDDYSDSEMTAELEREFEEELRSIM